MSNYNVQEESRRALLDAVSDDRLGFTAEVKEACKTVQFIGDSKPFLPTPMKFTESVSALSALVGVCAASVVTDRYGEQQQVTVNTYVPHVGFPHGRKLNDLACLGTRQHCSYLGFFCPRSTAKALRSQRR
jgi:hypothetical protein